VSNKCGCADDLVINGKNGFTFSPENIEHLTDCMLKLMKNEVDSEEMGKASEQIIADYSPERVALEMYQGFQKILRKNKTTSER
jgi:glycosyltransferase involved in cell wall biosynthesis